MGKLTLKIALAMALGMGILWLLFRNTDIHPFLSMLRSVKSEFFLLVLAGYISSFYFKTLRFSMAFNVNRFIMFQIIVIHNFVNRLLPLRLGEFALPYLMRRHLQVNFLDGLGMLFLIRFVDVFVIVFLATVSLLLSMPGLINHLTLAAVCALMLLQLVVLFRMKLCMWLLSSLLRRLKIKSAEKLGGKFEAAAEVLSRRGNTKFMLRLLAYSFGTWCTSYLIYYGFTLMFNLRYSYVEVIMAASLVTITGNILVNNVAQLGSFELGWTIGFVYLAGMSKDIAVPMAFFVNIACMVITTVLAVISYAALNLHPRRKEAVANAV